jgi:UDP-glucose 6-dehydrogenase
MNLKWMQTRSVVCTGYVGLSTAACFVSRGYHKEKVEMMSSKKGQHKQHSDEMLMESAEFKLLVRSISATKR